MNWTTFSLLAPGLIIGVFAAVYIYTVYSTINQIIGG